MPPKKPQAVGPLSAALMMSLALAWPAGARAQEAPESQELQEGGEIVLREVLVTATRTERDLMAVPMSVSVVSEQDLKREPAVNVADALADIPGVAVTDGGMPGGKRVMIRGENPMRSLILIDGVKVSEQKSMSGSAILIDTSQIERIEVIKGPASVLYGSEAIGGVVNIITKKGGDKPVGFSQQLVADSSTASVDIQSAVFGTAGGFNYRFSASGVNAGDRRGADGVIANSSYRNRNYSGRVGYDWDGASVYLRADRYESEIHIPTNVSSGLAPFTGVDGLSGPVAGYAASVIGMNFSSSTDVALYLPRWDRESVSGGFELRDLSENLARLKGEAYFQNMKKDFYNNVHVANYLQFMIGPLLEDLYITVDKNIRTYNDQDSYGGHLQSDWRLGGHYVIAGADYNKDDITADDYRLGGYVSIFMTPGAPPGNPSVIDITVPDVPAAYRYKLDQSAVGLFVQDEWSFADDWTATLGLRETWVDSRFKFNNNPDLNDLRSIGDSRLVGNVGLVYRGLENLSLRAMWAQGYRFPSLNQLYLGTTHGQQGFVHPNPDLAPETSNNYEIGARYQGENWNLDLAAFHSDAKNFITYNRIAGGDWRFENLDQARTFGAELGLDYSFEDYGLTPYVNAAWLKRRISNHVTAVTVTGTGAGAVIDYRRVGYRTDDSGLAPFSGRLGLKWRKEFGGPELYSDLYVNWASKAKNYRYDSDYSLGFVTDEYAAWQTLNLTLGARWGEARKWNASLSLRNIGDQGYTRAENNIEDPGFHVILGVGFEY
ncbi:MAG: TonB-dependent receptor [Candidatus Adiutrix sp.]|nr:TonB-dependent receptor [Candidatus Adiutrix sp.]